MGVSINGGSPKWMVYKENPLKVDDLGYSKIRARCQTRMAVLFLSPVIPFPKGI